MSYSDRTLWGIHGGSNGEADSLFLKKNCIALGWSQMPDLSSLGADRDEWKAAVAAAYPGAKPGAIPNYAGQLFRFVREVKVGDLVAYPSKMDRRIHIGEVTGGYSHDKSSGSSFPHRRAVKWIKNRPRTSFSQGALYEIGSALSFFQLKNYSSEYLAALSNGEVIRPVEDDETVGIIASEIEETTRDFILKTLAQELKGHPFASFIAHLLETMGYQTRVAPEGPDGGVDIVASKDELGFEPPIIKVQVKSTEGNIGNQDVSSLYGNVDTNEFGLLFNLGGFTTQAKNFARNKTNLRLIDGPELVKLVLNHYHQFDSGYKGLIPLKQIYIPEPKTESED